MTKDGRIRVVACQCPGCGADLEGLGSDRLFVCSDCGTCNDLTPSLPVVYPIHYVLPAAPLEGKLLVLPVWKFQVQITIRCDDVDKLEKARQVLPDFVYIPAFKMHGLSVYGNLSLIWTSQQPEILLSPEKYPMTGCRRTENGARESLDYLILMVIDRKVDVTDMNIEVAVRQSQILGYPFFDLGKTLKDGILGVELLAIAFDDLAEIRKTANH
jgi:hypothetical protein